MLSRLLGFAMVLSLVGCAGAAPERLPLKGPLPAKLLVDGTAGAAVYVDDVFVGTAPLTEPVLAEPGDHVLRVAQSGHLTHVEKVKLHRGKTLERQVSLEMTGQRKASWALLGTGAAGVSAGIVLGTLSVVEMRKARDIEDQAPDEENLGDDDQRAFDEATDAQESYRLGSGIAAGIGLGLVLVGAGLYAFDEPEAPQVAIEPSIGPEAAGVTGTVRF
jgi:hypothetical protein